MGVSVVVPTRNRSALLATTLRSVLQQQKVELEAIVVDEASTDDTAAVVSALNDRRIRLVRHETPLGVSAARNHGAAESQSEWLAFVDDDNLWAPDKLACQIEAADATGRDWAYTGAVNISDSGRVIHGRPPPGPEEVLAALPHHNAIPAGGSNVAVRRAAWLQTGPFDTRLRNTEDWEMWIRLAKRGAPACVSRPLIGYRVHDSNASLDIGEIVRGTTLIEVLHHTTADWGRLHRWMAESCLRRGQRTAALGQFVRAALQGQARGVAADVTDILRRRLARRAPEQDRAMATDAWIAAAEAWLRPLEDSAREPHPRMGPPVTLSGEASHG